MSIPECVQCRISMKVAKVMVKRPVPPGGTDLGKYDEELCWKCPECGGRTNGYFGKCRGCGSLTVNVQMGEVAPGIALWMNDHCSNCQKCIICGSVIGFEPFGNRGGQSYYHNRCQEQEQERYRIQANGRRAAGLCTVCGKNLNWLNRRGEVCSACEIPERY